MFRDEEWTSQNRDSFEFKDGLVSIIADEQNFLSFSFHGLEAFTIANLHACSYGYLESMMNRLKELALANDVKRIVYADVVRRDIASWMLEYGFDETVTFSEKERFFEFSISEED